LRLPEASDARVGIEFGRELLAPGQWVEHNRVGRESSQHVRIDGVAARPAVESPRLLEAG